MKPLLPRAARKIRTLFYRAAGFPAFRKSYSQQGEDMILDCLFQGKESGFYVDVGAHHPERYSNTCLFYRRGWRGINIDATPGSMAIFRRRRGRDINLECAVAGERKTLTFHLFNEPALNGFSTELSQARDGAGGYRQIGERRIDARPLRELLDEHLPAGQHIDFLSVDVEGLDMEVLRSNDWSKYRPTLVIAEDISEFVVAPALLDLPLVTWMRGIGYSLCGKAVHSLIFVADEQVRYGADHSVTIGPPPDSTP